MRPRRVRPVRWQIKGCQTTEPRPRTFDSGFSGKVNLSTLSFMVHLRTYLFPSVYPITYLLFRVSPLCTTKLDTPSLTRRSSFHRVRPETQLCRKMTPPGLDRRRWDSQCLQVLDIKSTGLWNSCHLPLLPMPQNDSSRVGKKVG